MEKNKGNEGNHWFIDNNKLLSNAPITYAVIHKDESIRSDSRSGGFFTALSDIILEENGVIYGCILNEDFQAIHIRATNRIDRDRMRGSKYVQSAIGNSYVQAKKDLEDGRKVLFTGTSCQIAALKSFLGKNYDNLICMDILCHGVPSSLVWQEYLQWQINKHGDLESASFRNKKDFGWRSHIETLIFNKNGRREKISCDLYKTLFYKSAILRPCCYNCPYKGISHPADITIADYWGIENAAPQFDDNKGVSLVLVNDALGAKMFEQTKDSIKYVKTSLSDSMQKPLIEPYNAPDNREQFWVDFYNLSFTKVLEKYCAYGWKNNIRKRLGKIKKKFFP